MEAFLVSLFMRAEGRKAVVFIKGFAFFPLKNGRSD
jgi:hypothetical protein